jgi:hypothetical protein
MADRKISDLTALTTPAAGDYLPIVDISEPSNASKNKRIDVSVLLSAIPAGTVTSAMIADGAIVNADINASAAIAGTKISPDFGSQALATTGLISANGKVSFPLGTAALPSLYPGTDTNTGIYSPGADQVAISTNGTGRLFVDASGNVFLNNSSSRSTVAATSTRSVQINSGGASEAELVLYSEGANDAVFGHITFGGIRTSVGASARISANRRGEIVFGNNDAANGVNTVTERMRITADGRLGLGTSSPDALLTVNGVGAFGAGTAALPSIARSSDLDTGAWFPAANTFAVSTGGSERARIDSSGRVLIGTSTNVAIGAIDPQLLLTGTSGGTSILSLQRYSNNVSGAGIYLGKSRSSSAGNFAAVQQNDILGEIRFYGANGTDFSNTGATLRAEVDGDPFTAGDTTDLPCRLVLLTALDGSGSNTEGLRITNDKVVCYNQAAPAAVNATATLTAANLKTGLITSTSAAATDMTLPTGTDTEGGFSGIYTNMTFEWGVINTGPSLVTVLANTAHTLVGSGAVATGTSARFASRRTASNTFVSYRLS